MLGDVIMAEPGALIGFAGQRVIKQTVGVDLPEGFQRSEFLLEHGLIDMIVNRMELHKTLSDLFKFFKKDPKVELINEEVESIEKIEEPLVEAIIEEKQEVIETVIEEIIVSDNSEEIEQSNEENTPIPKTEEEIVIVEEVEKSIEGAKS